MRSPALKRQKKGIFLRKFKLALCEKQCIRLIEEIDTLFKALAEVFPATYAQESFLSIEATKQRKKLYTSPKGNRVAARCQRWRG